MRHFPSPDIGLFGRRQRHARGHRIPVNIVRGGDAAGSPDAALVIDHFGADDVTPLAGGCACCTVRVKLQNALRQVLSERDNKPFNRLTIETDNDLGPVLRTFATERALGAELYVEDAPNLSGVGGVQNFVLIQDAPLSWDAFSRFIATLTALRGADLLHVKGMLNIAGCRGPVVVHFMQHLALPPVELQAWPVSDHRSHIAFTTRNIEEKMVRALFDSVRALA
jgi:G3E family GTPase